MDSKLYENDNKTLIKKKSKSMIIAKNVYFG